VLGFEHAYRLGPAAIDQRRDFRVGIDIDKATRELVAVADADRPGVIFSLPVAALEQFLEHDAHFLAVGRGERIELQGVLADRELFFVGRPSDRAVDVGEFAAARLVPGPDFRGNVVGAVGHYGPFVAQPAEGARYGQQRFPVTAL
jgi:hypothetical protein